MQSSVAALPLGLEACELGWSFSRGVVRCGAIVVLGVLLLSVPEAVPSVAAGVLRFCARVQPADNCIRKQRQAAVKAFCFSFLGMLLLGRRAPLCRVGKATFFFARGSPGCWSLQQQKRCLEIGMLMGCVLHC